MNGDYAERRYPLARRRLLQAGFAGVAVGLIGGGVGRAAAQGKAAQGKGAQGAAVSGETAMNMRTIPSTGEAIPVVGLGTWKSFDVAPGEDASAQRAVLRRFFDAGGRVVDSSPMYGNSERVVGELAAELGIGDELFLATKVWTRGRADGIAQMERSEALLRTGRIDLMQVHNLLDLRTHLRTLAEWKAEGRVRYVGITHYTESAHDELVRLIEAEPLDFVQFNYNILERNAERRLLPAARDRGVATIVNEPFGSGALFRRVRGHALPAWAGDHGCRSWAQLFLKFVLGHPAVTCVIPATRNPEHVVENAMAGHGEFPDEAGRTRMAEAVAAL